MIFNPLFLKNPVIDRGIFTYVAPALEQPKYVFADIVKYVLESEPESDSVSLPNPENSKVIGNDSILKSLLENTPNSVLVNLPGNSDVSLIYNQLLQYSETQKWNNSLAEKAPAQISLDKTVLISFFSN